MKPVIGLVGGIGAGKSLVARLLAERGGVVIAADAVAHEALRQPDIRERVVAQFGTQLLGDDGEIVRSRLARPVFADEARRHQLEAIVFPWIGMKLHEAIATAQTDPIPRFLVLDAAIMLEAGWNKTCDRLVYVHTPREQRLARLAERGWTPEQLTARERAQWPLTEKVRRADVAIDNGGTPEQTGRQVDSLLKQWQLGSA